MASYRRRPHSGAPAVSDQVRLRVGCRRAVGPAGCCHFDLGAVLVSQLSSSSSCLEESPFVGGFSLYRCPPRVTVSAVELEPKFQRHFNSGLNYGMRCQCFGRLVAMRCKMLAMWKYRSGLWTHGVIESVRVVFRCVRACVRALSREGPWLEVCRCFASVVSMSLSKLSIHGR